jgi:hypothetical protein
VLQGDRIWLSRPVLLLVMPVLVTGIHAFSRHTKAWMAGTSPVMTMCERSDRPYAIALGVLPSRAGVEAGGGMRWRIMLDLERGRRHAAGVRGRRRRALAGRAWPGDPGFPVGGGQGGAGRAAAPSRCGAGGRALPQSAPLRLVRGAAPAERPTPAALELAVRGGGGACPPLRPVPVRCRLPPLDHAGGGDHARPLHAGV